MRQFLTAQVDRIARRAARQIVGKPKGDSFDLNNLAYFSAGMDSLSYFSERMAEAQQFPDDLSLLTHAMGLRKPDGLILEFGVASGRTIRHLASLTSQPLYGFDSFQGLPENWHNQFTKGSFAQPLPKAPNNVQLVAGWYDETLPSFVAQNGGDVSLLHIDCDLYSSTKTVFSHLEPFMTSGCVIVFDEYFNYPGWRGHEFKALQELELPYRYAALVPSHQQVCVVLD